MPPTETDKTKAIESFAQVLILQAPVRCCANAADCVRGPEDSGVVWCPSTSNPASLDAVRLRLGLNRPRTQKNPTGGGPKAAWFPSKDGWYEIATLPSDLAGAEVESGVYLVQYADASGEPFADEGRATLRLPDEPGTTGTSAGTAAAKPAEPRLAQHHLDELHRVGMDYRKIEAFAAETHAQGTRALLSLIIEREKAADERLEKQITLVRTCQDVALGQAEANGKMLQFSHEVLEKATKLTLSSGGPPSAQFVTALGDQFSRVLQDATTLYLVRSGQLKGPPGGGALGGSPPQEAQAGAPATDDRHLEIARLRAENDALRELAKLRAENAQLRQQQSATQPKADAPPVPQNPPPPSEPPPSPQVLDAEIVQTAAGTP